MKQTNYLTKLLPVLALTYACHTEPIKEPIRDEVIKDVNRMVVGGLLTCDSEVRFEDMDRNGKIDGLVYTLHRESERYVMAYDSNYYDAYNRVYRWKVNRAIKMTSALDSAMLNFIESAKEFKWKYELERYKQQKSP